MKRTYRYTIDLIIYTIVFNFISFIPFFLISFAAHNYDTNIWLVYGIAQVFFTFLVFRNVPFLKISDKIKVNKILVPYFVIMSAVSVIMAIIMYKTDSWFTLMFTNTFYTIQFFDLFNYLPLCIGIYLLENALKNILFKKQHIE